MIRVKECHIRRKMSRDPDLSALYKMHLSLAQTAESIEPRKALFGKPRLISRMNELFPL